MRELMANTVGAVEIQQLKHKHELKVCGSRWKCFCRSKLLFSEQAQT